MTQVQSETIALKGRPIDKIAKYKWLSRNVPGQLQYTPKASLQVDPSYQRALNNAKKLRIASNFNWAAFGVLIVARRNDGSLWVIDGQHRLMAAQSRSDIQDVPVVIFELDGNVMEEATDFLIANRERKPLTGVDSFKAMVVSGDTIALEVRDLIHSAGRVVSDSNTMSRKIRCVKAIYNCMTSNRDAMLRVWPLIVELLGEHDLDNRLVQGMHWLECTLMDTTGKKRSLTEPETQRKITSAGYTAVLRSIGDAAAYFNRGGQAIFARGILKVVNHKRRLRLTIRGDKEEEAG
jgi:hypothetical protein